jgi:transcriptional regulator with XRE-family HTH domain
MGTNKVERPERLAEKLLQIRMKLGLSQTEMANALEKYGVKMLRSYVGAYELKIRVPSSLVLLAYAKLAKISTDVIIDDELDLPAKYNDSRVP